MAKRIHDHEARIGCLPIHTRTVVFCGVGIVVASRGVRASRHGLCVAKGAHVPAHGIQCDVSIHSVESVREFTCGERAWLSSCKFLLRCPAVQCELVFDAPGQTLHCDFINVVTVVIRHFGARSTPSVETTIQIHRAKSPCILAHVNLKSDIRQHGWCRTRTVLRTLGKAGADCYIPVDVWQNPIVVISRVGTRQASDVFFATPIRAIAVQESVVACGAICQGD